MDMLVSGQEVMLAPVLTNLYLMMISIIIIHMMIEHPMIFIYHALAVFMSHNFLKGSLALISSGIAVFSNI
jgi:hypothetical protein